MNIRSESQKFAPEALLYGRVDVLNPVKVSPHLNLVTLQSLFAVCHNV